MPTATVARPRLPRSWRFPLEHPTGYPPSGMPEGDGITRGPLLVRSRRSSRWHRPRSGIQWHTDTRLTWLQGRVSLQLWCGQSQSSDYITASSVESIRDGLPICGPCEGKAIGAGYAPVASDPDEQAWQLTFRPRSQWGTPRTCPGRTQFEQVDQRIGRCVLCGRLERIRATSRGPYSWGPPVLTSHEPLDLCPPCPWHGWEYVSARDGKAVCHHTVRT